MLAAGRMCRRLDCLRGVMPAASLRRGGGGAQRARLTTAACCDPARRGWRHPRPSILASPELCGVRASRPGHSRCGSYQAWLPAWVAALLPSRLCGPLGDQGSPVCACSQAPSLRPCARRCRHGRALHCPLQPLRPRVRLAVGLGRPTAGQGLPAAAQRDCHHAAAQITAAVPGRAGAPAAGERCTFLNRLSLQCSACSTPWWQANCAEVCLTPGAVWLQVGAGHGASLLATWPQGVGVATAEEAFDAILAHLEREGGAPSCCLLSCAYAGHGSVPRRS